MTEHTGKSNTLADLGVTRTVDPASQGVYTETRVQHDDTPRAGAVPVSEFDRVLQMLEARDQQYQALCTQLRECEAHCRDQHRLLVQAVALTYHWPVRVGATITQALAADLQQWAAICAAEADHE